MPFLKAALIKKEPQEVRIERVLLLEPEVISGIRPTNDVPLPADRQIPLPLPNSEPDTTTTASTTKKKVNTTAQGREYEEYVGSLYKNKGYEVIYNGKKNGSHDGGIDLICKKGSYTVLVQCKCYDSGNVVLKDIYYLYGASRRYALKHLREVVQSSFWTTAKVQHTSKSEVFSATIELGILLYDNKKCETKKN